MLGGRWVAFLVAVAVAAPAAARVACPPARYQPDAAAGLAAGATIDVGDTVAIAGVCTPVARPGPDDATQVRGNWTGCAGTTGRARLRARLRDDCATLVGTLLLDGHRQRITAARVECGEGILDVAAPATPFVATRASLATHAIPAWYDDAKLGIMIHWGIFAVPAWAETVLDPADWLQTLDKLLDPVLGLEWFRHIPYTEWYANTILIDGTPAQAHHLATYGADFPYERFRPMFDAGAAGWSADAWADLFRAAHARYVVQVTKHHDGYALWPTEVPHPVRNDWHAARDYVGELARAVRSRCLRMGVYYSGNLDWSVMPGPIRFATDTAFVMPQTPAYVAYATGQWRELIARYRPSILWNDLSFPDAADELQLFADYYNAHPDGLVNDRFTILPALTHYDYRTAEYYVPDTIQDVKWEHVRGLGRGFGYNQNETDADLLTTTQLVHLLVDVVSKNGNLLLNVGPMADGTIPPAQAERLRGLGAWLDVNGEAIFGTRPWSVATGTTAEGTPVRFTQSADGGTLYAIVLGPLPDATVRLQGVAVDVKDVRLLGAKGRRRSRQVGTDLEIALPASPPAGPAAVFAIRPHR